MDEISFRESVIAACEKYHKFLQSKGGGCTKSTVLAFHRDHFSATDFVCQLNEKLTHLESCEVFVRNGKTSHISILKYKCGKDGIFVTLRVGKNPDMFADLNPSDIEIRSDITFLIERLGAFYRKNALDFSPKGAIIPPPYTLSTDLTPSDAQRIAIEEVFFNPVSYIWGPPGSGKTNVVLAECVLNYIHEDERIFLLAPTNNAVEQMLRSVLPTLKRSGIDLHTVYRLGTASEAFANEYPEVVASVEVNQFIADLADQKERLKNELDTSQRFYAQLEANEKQFSFIASLQNDISEFYSLQKEFDELQPAIQNAKNVLSAYAQESDSAKKKYEAKRKEYQETDVTVTELSSQLFRVRRFFWNRQKREQLSAALAKLIPLRDELRAQKADLEKASEACFRRVDSALDICNLLKNQSANIEQKQQDLLDDILISPFASDPFKTLFNDLRSKSEADALATFDNLLHDLSIEHELFRQNPPRSLEEINADLSALDEKLAASAQNPKLQQFEKARVIAGTVHSALKWLSPAAGKPAAHVFLDEAGYTSLALGTAVFACQCPVTFLGDHYQLAPICEMKSIPEWNKEVSLFSLPCAYLSELLYCSMSKFYELYNELNKKKNEKAIHPSFFTLPTFPLDKSFRFNDDLAMVLSQHIYPDRFFGVATSDFEIEVLDAKNPFPKAHNNTSLSEVHAIRNYFQCHPDIQSGTVTVLSPYNNQRELLIENLSEFNCAISTVHRAQGLEFDTVILSCVDKADPFFMNSNLHIGRSVLNTAVSRAKKRLVIACDVSYWSRQPGQLIYELIRLGAAPTPRPKHTPELLPTSKQLLENF